MVTDMLGTPLDVGHYVKHLPTDEIYLVRKVKRELWYGEIETRLGVQSRYRKISLTNKHVVRCLIDGKLVVDSTRVHVLD